MIDGQLVQKCVPYQLSDRLRYFLTLEQVLRRATTAIEELVEAANLANTRSVVAVSHNAFLRILIGMLLDESLIISAARKIWNASVTVVDVPNSLSARTDGSKLMLFGGPMSQKPKDFTLQIPDCTIIRINEFRHLPPSTLQQ